MRHFVIMGNTRVGSTWLQVCLHSLPGVFCTRELRWRMPYQVEAPPVHTYIDNSTSSIKERLESWLNVIGKRDVMTLGAKLKFDPFGYAPPSAFAKLGEIIEDDVHVIFVRRSYFEIFETWKAFGIRHLANPNANKKPNKNIVATSEEDIRLNRFYTMHSVPLEQKRVIITSDNNVIPRSLHNRYSGSDKIYYSISDAIDDLLVLFYNDVFGLSVIKGHDFADTFYYQDIRPKFFDVTQNLSLPVSTDDCRNALNNATTSQIEPPGLKVVYPDDALKEISAHLDSVFRGIQSGQLTSEDVVRVDEQKGSVSFHLPGLTSIFAKHEETEDLLRSRRSSSSQFLRSIFAPTRRVEGQYSRTARHVRSLFARKARVQNEDWLAQRPMYVPLAVAPKYSSTTRQNEKISHHVKIGK